MAPRKAKILTKTQTIDETPVVFFLKITEEVENEIIPAGETNSYSELDKSGNIDNISYSNILNSVEIFNKPSKFNTDLLKSVLDKISVDRYSAQTSCFWCCHGFSWSSVVLPISYDAYKNLYTCEGNFCSPECALAFNYADTKISDSIKWNKHALLGLLYSPLFKEKTLSPAPPRTLLRMFGGPLDIEQYRDYTTGDNDLVFSDLPPIRLQFPSMNVQGPLRDVKKYVSLSNDVIEKASEQLRLKRSKPTNINIPTLDMCLKK